MAVLWTFRCYVSTTGKDEIRDWHDRQSEEVQGRFLSRLRMLAQLPFQEWNENLYKNLHGPCAGLSEIRFKADRVQQRPLGYRNGEREFTFLFCATEKGGKFVPPSACPTALARKEDVVTRRCNTNALWLALE